MGVAKFDDGTPQNRKLIEAGPTAAWLWFCSVLYCRRALTDGFIPKAVVPTLVIGLKNPFKFAVHLVTVRLWHDVLGGYQVHDYLDWNPSKVQVEGYRKNDRDRKQRSHGEKSGLPNGIRTESERNPDDGAYTRGTHARAKSESLSESESTVSGLGISEESPRETKPLALAVSAIHPGRLIDGAEIRRHGGHAWCSWPGRDGLCVPRFLQDEFAGKHGNAAAVLAWYPTVIARYQGVPIGEDALVFWRHEFAAWVGTVTAAPSHGGKGNASRDAMARVLQKRAAARGETL